MTRTQHLRQALDEFQASYPAVSPLLIETVWHRTWTTRQARAFNRQSGWRKSTGVYLFIDFCAENDSRAESTEERFSVIRRIGKAEYRFADRITDYGDRVTGGQGARVAWDWWDNDWQQWFRYSQIDIIRINAVAAASLEAYLLTRIPTQCNDRDVPADLRGSPIIYDARSNSENGYPPSGSALAIVRTSFAGH